jgi:tetratricopeptide (TPR) repeat protein
LNENGQYNAALVQFDKSKKSYNDSRVYINSGLAHEKLGNYKQALRDYEMAYLIQPGRIYPMYLLAKLNRKLLDTVKAKNYARRILSSEITVKRFISTEIVQEMKDLLASNWMEKLNND